MRQHKAVGGSANLYRNRMAVDEPAPHRIARLPRRHQHARRADVAVSANNMHGDALGLARHVEAEPKVAKTNRTAALARYLAAGHLTGDAALSFTEHMVDCGSDRCNPLGEIALRRGGMKALRELLGDETS